MGLGTARGGCQFCKLDVQMGSIPVRSTYTDIAQLGEHFPYKEGAGSSILPVSIKRVCSVKVAHVLWEHVEPFESDIFDLQDAPVILLDSLSGKSDWSIPDRLSVQV